MAKKAFIVLVLGVGLVLALHARGAGDGGPREAFALGAGSVVPGTGPLNNKDTNRSACVICVLDSCEPVPGDGVAMCYFDASWKCMGWGMCFE